MAKKKESKEEVVSKVKPSEDALAIAKRMLEKESQPLK